jgi:hypothetical protein
MVMPQDAFRYTKGEVKQRPRDAGHARVLPQLRHTHLATRPPRPVVVVKVVTLDDPKVYGAPSLAIFTIDMQPFHMIPDGLPTFERRPG